MRQVRKSSVGCASPASRGRAGITRSSGSGVAFAVVLGKLMDQCSVRKDIRTWPSVLTGLLVFLTASWICLVQCFTGWIAGPCSCCKEQMGTQVEEMPRKLREQMLQPMTREPATRADALMLLRGLPPLSVAKLSPHICPSRNFTTQNSPSGQ